jgi:hypothetical protein
MIWDFEDYMKGKILVRTINSECISACPAEPIRRGVTQETIDKERNAKRTKIINSKFKTSFANH